jgi:hypothetical protein
MDGYWWGVLGIFGGAWAFWASRTRGWGLIVQHGGGFIAGCLTLIAVGMLWRSGVTLAESSHRGAAISATVESEADGALIQKAVDVLSQNCWAFREAGPDLQNGTAKLRSGEISWKRDYGWDRMVEVEVVIASPPKILPVKTGSGYSGGHHCYYHIGSGDAPGLSTDKEVCREICGWSEFFVSEPKLDGLLGHKPFKRGYDFDAIRTGAMRGNYQDQRNLAYIMQTEKRDTEAFNPVMACAWRKIILATGGSRVDESDHGNEEVACNHLTTDEQAQAETQFQQLLKEIKPHRKGKKANRL